MPFPSHPVFFSLFLFLSPPRVSLSLSGAHPSSFPSTSTISSQTGAHNTDIRKCGDFWTSLQLNVLLLTPENLITVTLHATVRFMGCLFIKLTLLEIIKLMLQRAWPGPVKCDEISHLLVHTWSPLVHIPRVHFCPSPFSGFWSDFGNCMYGIKNPLGINGLCISIFIHHSEYLRVYLPGRSIFSVEQQSIPGFPDNQSCCFAHSAMLRPFKTVAGFHGECVLQLTSWAKEKSSALSVIHSPRQLNAALWWNRYRLRRRKRKKEKNPKLDLWSWSGTLICVK